MAKRRKIAAPSVEDLNRIEEEFRRETLARPNPGMAPIAQVAADSAQAKPVSDPGARVQMAHDMADAKKYRIAAEQGRVIESLPIESIQADVLVRDRTVIDAEEMAELKTSISDHGLRLPIEVFARREGRTPYALLSGYRRLRALRELHAETGDPQYKSVRALVRNPEELGGGFAAMVEENEIRANLSHFERGRIAVIAAQRGAYPSTEAAVAALFKAASKAKRSKIRSFAVIFEELGDLLAFPEALKEREGLQLAAALRGGATARLRARLEEAGPAISPVTEWALLSDAMAATTQQSTPEKGGRPKKPGPEVLVESVLENGVTLRAELDRKGYAIRVTGRGVDANLIEWVMEQLESALKREPH